MAQAKTPVIVTKNGLRDMLMAAPTIERQAQIIGRALVVLFNGQTEGEKAANTTNMDNSIGFASADARSGSLSAKSYIKHGTLMSWQVAKWMEIKKDGYPKICKYHRQLNRAAIAKAAAKSAAMGQTSLLV